MCVCVSAKGEWIVASKCQGKAWWSWNIHTHTHTYIQVCVCACVSWDKTFLKTFLKITHWKGHTAKHRHPRMHAPPVQQHPSVISGSSTFTLAFRIIYHLPQLSESNQITSNLILFTLPNIINLLQSSLLWGKICTRDLLSDLNRKKNKHKPVEDQQWRYPCSRTDRCVIHAIRAIILWHPWVFFIIIKYCNHNNLE